MGCSQERERPAYQDVEGGEGGSPAQPRCEDGASRPCSLVLEQANGVVSCWKGTEYCEEGTWGDCVDGERVDQADPTEALWGSQRLLAAGAPQSCLSQPCDPTCQFWVDSSGVAAGAAGCAHDVCTPGVKLDATCSPCAQTVCTVDATCCSTTWDNHCTQLAYQHCANTTPPLSLCDFGLFSSGTNQMTITGLQTQSQTMIGGRGNITVQSSPRNVRRILTTGPVTCTADVSPPGGITAGGSISMFNNTYSTVGPLESGGRIDGQNFTVLGDLSARTDVWAGSATVTGTGRAGASIYVANNCGGGCTPNSGYAGPTITLPTLTPPSFTCANLADQTYGGNATLTPGAYGDYHIENGRLILDATADAAAEHVYVFEKLYVKEIELRGTGRFVIRSCTELNLMQGGSMYEGATTRLSDPTRLYLEVMGNLHFQSDVDFIGVVNAASSGTKSGGSITGAIWANPVNDINNQQYITGMTIEQCLAAQIPGSGRPACTIPAPPSGGTGERSEVYQADCSKYPGSAARWGLLTWNATLSGAGTANFAARVAATQAALGSRLFTNVGNASAGNPDCHLGQATPCWVDVSQFFPVALQGPFLELRVRASAGSGTATVDDWRLTYSCVYDQ